MKRNRILLKLSGEALKTNDFFWSFNKIQNICEQIKTLKATGHTVAIVVGGGNIWRGQSASSKLNLKQQEADYLGMMATAMNAYIIKNTLTNMKIKAVVQSALGFENIAEKYNYNKMLQYLNEDDKVVIFAAGTGAPFFTTDTAAALRAREMSADVILMGKFGVDGVYEADPKVNPAAKRYDHLSYQQVLLEKIGIMDLTAITMCKEADLELLIFDITTTNAIIDVLAGKIKHTIINGQNK